MIYSYFSSPRNGYPPGLDPRFPAFKTAATPFVGLMAPLGAPQPSTVSTTSPLSNKDPKEQKQDSLFGNPVFPPMLDMSSTQALLHMVRTANAAQNAAELETYLKGNYKIWFYYCWILILFEIFIFSLIKTMVEICEVFGNHIASHWDKFYFVFEKIK